MTGTHRYVLLKVCSHQATPSPSPQQTLRWGKAILPITVPVKRSKVPPVNVNGDRVIQDVHTWAEKIPLFFCTHKLQTSFRSNEKNTLDESTFARTALTVGKWWRTRCFSRNFYSFTDVIPHIWLVYTTRINIVFKHIKVITARIRRMTGGYIFTLCVCPHLGGGTYFSRYGRGGGVPTFPGLDGGGGYLPLVSTPHLG